MPRLKTVHRCTECGGEAPRWVGRCPACGEWNTLVEERSTPERSTVATVAAGERALPIAEVDAGGSAPRPTGIGELDRVLGGGLVPGSVTLVAGEPGVGKSTLLLQACGAMAEVGARVLYASAEESRQQVRLRAERLGTLAPRLWLASSTSLPELVVHLDDVRPHVVVVDSIQTVHDPELGSAPGTVAQVRECAHRLVREAKDREVATMLVGHVTKEGEVAGPRALEHVVDTVLAFEGDHHHALRVLRAVKHRFGSTHDLGLFEMGEAGLVGVPDPSGLLLGDRRADVPGSVVVAAVDGHRPLLVEVQSLVASTSLPVPRRYAQGLDGARLATLVAVLEQRVGLTRLQKAEVYASAVGGIRVTEPAADLAVGLAIASSVSTRPVAPDLVACGEVGLGGELRQVAQGPRRLAEAARLGFRQALVPASAPDPPPGLRLMRARTLAEAIGMAGCAAD